MSRQKDVFIVADNIVSPLGLTTAENFSQLVAGSTGVQRQERPEMADQPFYAALFGPLPASPYTKFEQLLVASVAGAVHQAPGVRPNDDRTILIVFSTKGNTHLLDDDRRTSPERISLPGSAALLARHFGFTQTPIVV